MELINDLSENWAFRIQQFKNYYSEVTIDNIEVTYQIGCGGNGDGTDTFSLSFTKGEISESSVEIKSNSNEVGDDSATLTFSFDPKTSFRDKGTVDLKVPVYYRIGSTDSTMTMLSGSGIDSCRSN